MANTEVNNNKEQELVAISLRDVERDVWRDFKKLAILHDMTLQDYLKHVVAKEMSHVQISK